MKHILQNESQPGRARKAAPPNADYSNGDEPNICASPSMHGLKKVTTFAHPRGAANLFRQGVVLCPLLLSLGACTTVRIQTADDTVRIERHWGVLTIEFIEPDGSHVAEVSALGLLQSPFGWSAGYSHQSWAALGPECRLVLWVSTPQDMEIARRLAESSPGTCAITPSTGQMEANADAH